MIVKERTDATEVYYFDGYTVRHITLYGRKALRDLEIAALEVVEAAYREKSPAQPFTLPSLN